MSNQPTYHAYSVKDQEGDKKGIWTKIGAAWPHQDGKGFNIELEFIPVSTGGSLKITLREPQEKPETSDQDQKAA